jgi:hypothetical protein
MCLTNPQEPQFCARAALRLQRSWLDWAAAQINASLALDHEAMANLVTAIRVIIGALDKAVLAVSTGGRPTLELDLIATHAAGMVAAVQSHDRLAQQLSHVAEALQSLGAVAAIAPAPTESDWEALRHRQLRSFSMREERELFHRVVPNLRGDDGADASDKNNVQSVELF